MAADALRRAPTPSATGSLPAAPTAAVRGIPLAVVAGSSSRNAKRIAERHCIHAGRSVHAALGVVLAISSSRRIDSVHRDLPAHGTRRGHRQQGAATPRGSAPSSAADAHPCQLCAPRRFAIRCLSASSRKISFSPGSPATALPGTRLRRRPPYHSGTPPAQTRTLRAWQRKVPRKSQSVTSPATGRRRALELPVTIRKINSAAYRDWLFRCSSRAEIPRASRALSPSGHRIRVVHRPGGTGAAIPAGACSPW